MAEYIERESLIGWLHNMAVSPALIAAIENKERFPADDVAEVVRCKDCKHYYHGTCTNDFALNLMRKNDYCSYGERRSENES